MRFIVPLLAPATLLLLAGCDGTASAVAPPPGPTAALAPAPADPGHSGVSAEAGSGAQGLTGPYPGGAAAAPNGPLLDGGPSVPAPVP